MKARGGRRETPFGRSPQGSACTARTGSYGDQCEENAPFTGTPVSPHDVMNVALMLIVYSSLVSVNALIPFLANDGIVLSQSTLVAQSFVDVHVVDE